MKFASVVVVMDVCASADDPVTRVHPYWLRSGETASQKTPAPSPTDRRWKADGGVSPLTSAEAEVVEDDSNESILHTLTRRTHSTHALYSATVLYLSYILYGEV